VDEQWKGWFMGPERLRQATRFGSSMDHGRRYIVGQNDKMGVGLLEDSVEIMDQGSFRA